MRINIGVALVFSAAVFAAAAPNAASQDLAGSRIDIQGTFSSVCTGTYNKTTYDMATSLRFESGGLAKYLISGNEVAAVRVNGAPSIQPHHVRMHEEGVYTHTITGTGRFSATFAPGRLSLTRETSASGTFRSGRPTSVVFNEQFNIVVREGVCAFRYTNRFRNDDTMNLQRQDYQCSVQGNCVAAGPIVGPASARSQPGGPPAAGGCPADLGAPMKCIRFELRGKPTSGWQVYAAINTCNYRVAGKYHSCELGGCNANSDIDIPARQRQAPVDSLRTAPYMVSAHCVPSR